MPVGSSFIHNGVCSNGRFGQDEIAQPFEEGGHLGIGGTGYGWCCHGSPIFTTNTSVSPYDNAARVGWVVDGAERMANGG